MGSLSRLAHLQERVLSVDALLDALVAEVSVRADGAHPADTLNRSNFAAITDDLIVDGGILVSLLVGKVIFEHLSEGRVAVVLDLLTDHGGDG